MEVVVSVCIGLEMKINISPVLIERVLGIRRIEFEITTALSVELINVFSKFTDEVRMLHAQIAGF